MSKIRNNNTKVKGNIVWPGNIISNNTKNAEIISGRITTLKGAHQKNNPNESNIISNVATHQKFATVCAIPKH